MPFQKQKAALVVIAVTFFDVFKGQLDASFRLCTSKDVNTPDSLEPLDSSGQPLLGEDGRPMSVNDFLDQLRIHPVYGFLFQQRGAMYFLKLYRVSSASPSANKKTSIFLHWGQVRVMLCRSFSNTNRCSGSLGEGRKPKCS